MVFSVLTISLKQALDASVVNRIAAGEIIIAPANALKELLENSLDAGSSKIDVVVKDGGLKLLQITDDGTGIDKEDLSLLCQRFATSKITQFEDLESISTYGFRGEALASISHISHLSVVTKTAQSSCAWRATYSDGELKEVKPTAGKTGTQIIVEDLFYNVPARLRSVKGGSEELAKIVDVIGRYSIHTDLGYSVKKFGDSHFSLSTRPGLPIKERIRSLFGTSVAQELVPFEVDPMEELGLKGAHGQITNPNYNSKKSIQPVFFINNRLVSNDRLRRALNSTIQHFLPKGHKPFIYLSLLVDPSYLDVNVHPTKREVKFLHEDEIIDAICITIREELIKIDSSRTFPTQSLLPQSQKRKVKDEEVTSQQNTQQSQKKTRLDYKLVRTDSSQAKITNFMRPVSISISSTNEDDRMDEEGDTSHPVLAEDTTVTTMSLPTVKDSPQYKAIQREKIIVNLHSVLELRQEVLDAASDAKLAEMFTKFTYIGIIDTDKRLLSIQSGVKLLMIDYGALFREFFYQLALQDFENFGYIRLEGCDTSLKSLLGKAYDGLEDPPIPMDECIEYITSMSDMLEEYFSISVADDGEGPVLKTLPLLVKGYIPPLEKLPIFLYRIGCKINWEDEKECIEGILQQLALFNVPMIIPESKDDETSQYAEQQSHNLNETMENILMPLVKKRFLAPSELKDYIVEIANLPGLYRVFERC